MSILSQSGGLIYHWRALRNYLDPSHPWSNHLASVSSFLDRWNPKSKTLILVGPSAGYSLPIQFLKRFDHVIGVEPDPLARFLFQKRFQIRPEWINEPFSFLHAQIIFPKVGAILFCNVLGQIEIADLNRARSSLTSILSSREWASYHDAFSSTHGKFQSSTQSQSVQKKMTEAQVRVCFTPAQDNPAEVHLNEHSAFELFQESGPYRFSYWPWQLSRRQSHLIEGVSAR